MHVLRPAQDSSVVWLGGLTSREELMSPECSKHQSPVFLVRARRFISEVVNRRCSVKKVKKFANLTGKYLFWLLFLIKL